MKLMFVSLLILLNFHPLHVGLNHVGLTTIEIDENDKKLNVLFKLDMESFQYILIHDYLYEFKPDNTILNDKEVGFINEYIQNKFLLKINTNEAKLMFNSHKIENNEISLNYNAEILTSVDSILVRNLLLFDINMYQKNVVIIKSETFEKGYLIDRDNTIIKQKMKNNS